MNEDQDSFNPVNGEFHLRFELQSRPFIYHYEKSEQDKLHWGKPMI